MKKLFLAALVSIFAISLNAQNVNDVWLLIQNNNIAGAQKKIEECMKISTYQTDATAWLYRGNVYLRIYERDIERVKKNPEYVTRYPEAIFTAYESFYKAIELNPKIEAVTGLVAPKDGQLTCGSEMYKTGSVAYEEKDYPKAKKYLATAAKALSSDESTKEFSGYAYFYLYRIALAEQDKEAQKGALDDAIAMNTSYDVIYRLAYDLYSKSQDTVRCGEILKSAKKYVPKTKRGNIYALELSYLIATGDSVQLEKCFKNVKKYTDDTIVMADCANYLVNAKGFDQAKELLDSALLIHPDCFSLNSMVAYNYFMQASELGTLSTKVMSRSDISFNEKLALSDQYNADKTKMMEEAYTWAVKAYEMNKTDHTNNSILKQTGLQLKKDIPAELQ